MLYEIKLPDSSSREEEGETVRANKGSYFFVILLLNKY